MADDFDRDHQDGHQRVSDKAEAHIGTRELLDVADTALNKALNVVVEERRQSDAGGNRREHRGRFEGGDDADEVGEKNKEKDCAEEGNVTAMAVVNVVVRVVV